VIDHYAPWHTVPYVVIDTETTGVSKNDRIIQLGVARYQEGHLVSSWSTLVWSDIEVPSGATAVHGITTAMLAQAPTFTEVIPDLLKICADAWPAAYNASFDQRMLQESIKRTALTDLERLEGALFLRRDCRWFDPLVWSRHVDRWEKSGHKLVTVCQRYGIPVNAHDARADAVASGRLLWELRDKINAENGGQDMTPTEMLRRQTLIHQGWERRMAAWRNAQKP